MPDPTREHPTASPAGTPVPPAPASQGAPPAPPDARAARARSGVITLHPLMMGSNVPHGLGLDEITIRLLESSFQAICQSGDAFARHFYDRVLADYPGLRPMFKSDPAVQRQKLVDSLAAVIEGLRTPDLVRTKLQSLGAKHADLGVKKEHYPIVCDYLLRSMRETLGPLWNSRLEQEWGRALVMISQIMLSGMGPEAPGRPPVR